MNPTSKEETPALSLRAAVPILLFLALIFFLNFTSRVIFSPLLPVISDELGLDYLQSGSVFFSISLGYFVSILCSGYLSSRLNHKNTIALAACLSGVMLCLLAQSSSFLSLRVGLVAVGIGAGFYFPSGLTTIGKVVPPGYLARGMAVHELAPNLSFVLTPLICSAMLLLVSWRQGLMAIGAALFGIGIAYYFKGEKNAGYGTAPRIELLLELMRLREFWLVTTLFSMAICSTMGIFALLPLYLTDELGMDGDAANLLVSLSRVSSIVMPIVGGWLGDKYGNMRVMTAVLFLAGLATVPMGFTDGTTLLVFVVVQAMIAVCFFPSGFAVVSTIGTKRTKGTAVTLALPFAFLVGGGVLPSLIGGVGDISRLGHGFAIAGGLMMLVAVVCATFMPEKNNSA